MDKTEQDGIDDYLRVISHELKSPINAIKTLLDTVVEGYAGDVEERTRFVVEKAARRAEEAREIISDIMHYQRYGEEAKDEELDLTGLIRGTADRYSTEAAERDVSFRVELPDGIDVYIRGDQTGLEHAIRNLVENAIKYTGAEGSVELRLSASEQSESAIVEVVDDGPGISEEDQAHLFEPFFRAPAQASSTTGTGLGLAIVRRVVESHAGTIRVDSEVGSGSTFTIELPIIRVAEAEPEPARRRIVIIGGVTAGPKVAARLRRLDEELDITIVERHRFLSYAGCGLPWYISGRIDSPRELNTSGDTAQRDDNFFESIDNIRIRNNTEAESIDRAAKRVDLRDEHGTRRSIPYDTLVLATGAVPVEPPIEGVDLPGVCSLRSVEDADRIKRLLSEGGARDVCIIGGGLIGISTADEILNTGARITILEKRATVLAELMDPDVARRVAAGLSEHGVKILTGREVTAIGSSGTRLRIEASDEIHEADLIILSTGVRPNTDLAASAGLEIGTAGGIVVDEHLATSDPSIYAVGDCVETVNIVTGTGDYRPLGSVSTKMGRIAADAMFGLEASFPGSVGSAMFKLRTMQVARTGLTTEAATTHGFDVETAVVTGKDRAHYDESAADLALKVIVDGSTRRIIGAQGFGTGDVVSRIQLLALAVSRRMSIDDFFRTDIGYSPSYNTAIDIAQTACLVLANKLDGLVRTVHPDDLDEAASEAALVSVCPASSHREHELPTSINIPLERLRHDRFPFEKTRTIVLYSRTSAGAYSAYRYLTAKGYTEIRVLEGGYLYRTWRERH